MPSVGDLRPEQPGAAVGDDRPTGGVGVDLDPRGVRVGEDEDSVGDELHIARSTFYDWRAKRKAPRCIKLPNGDLRIRRTDLESWLSSHEGEAA